MTVQKRFRFEAASALAETSRNPCRYCTKNNCCSINVRKKLIKIATETNDKGCFVEPSPRVRRMARVALCNCECDPLDAVPQPIPEEGPSPEGAVPPTPDATVGIKIHEPGPSEQRVETATFAGKGADSKPGMVSQTGADVAGSSNPDKPTGPTIVKQYDRSFKQPDIIVNTSDVTTKAARNSARLSDSKFSNTSSREPTDREFVGNDPPSRFIALRRKVKRWRPWTLFDAKRSGKTHRYLPTRT